MSRIARSFAGLRAAGILATLVAQSFVAPYLRGPEFADYLARLWRMLAFFTIITHLAMGALFLQIARGKAHATHGGGAVFLPMLTASAILVVLVFHTQLARFLNPVGWHYWTNLALHSLWPALICLFWLAYGARRRHRWREIGLWMLFPLAYLAYVLVRGAYGWIYPYPFLNVARLGLGQVLVNVAAIGAVFAVICAALVGISRVRLFRR